MAKPKSKRNSILIKILDIVSDNKPIRVSNYSRPIPDVIDVLSSFLFGSRKQFYAITYRLFQDGYFCVDKNNLFRLSDKGRKIYDLSKLDKDIKKIRLNGKRVWDKKWRIVSFDIPEDKKDARRLLGGKLFDLNFKKLHNSVYVSPYECRDVIKKVSKFFGIEKHLSIIEAEYFDRQNEFRKAFKIR